MEIFNQAEKILMIKEFFLAEENNTVLNDELVKIDTPEFIQNFNFKPENLFTLNEEDLEENISDKSHNLGPFNTTESFGFNYQGVQYKIDIQEGKAEFRENDGFINFNEKTYKVNVLYERDHNKNIDNGVYKDDAIQEEIA